MSKPAAIIAKAPPWLPPCTATFLPSHSGRDVDEVGFYEVETWGEKFSALMAKYALQGRGVRIVGRLKQDRWKDENGKNHSKVFIVAEHVDFKPMKKSNVNSDETLKTKEKDNGDNYSAWNSDE